MVETRSSMYRSCVTSTSAPVYSSRLSSRISSVAMSRSFVGSSSSSTSAGFRISLAISTRALTAAQPFDGLVELLAGEQELRGITRDVDDAALVDDRVGIRRQCAAQRDLLRSEEHTSELQS